MVGAAAGVGCAVTVRQVAKVSLVEPGRGGDLVIVQRAAIQRVLPVRFAGGAAVSFVGIGAAGSCPDDAGRVVNGGAGDVSGVQIGREGDGNNRALGQVKSAAGRHAHHAASCRSGRRRNPGGGYAGNGQRCRVKLGRNGVGNDHVVSVPIAAGVVLHDDGVGDGGAGGNGEGLVQALGDAQNRFPDVHVFGIGQGNCAAFRVGVGHGGVVGQGNAVLIAHDVEDNGRNLNLETVVVRVVVGRCGGIAKVPGDVAAVTGAGVCHCGRKRAAVECTRHNLLADVTESGRQGIGDDQILRHAFRQGDGQGEGDVLANGVVGRRRRQFVKQRISQGHWRAGAAVVIILVCAAAIALAIVVARVAGGGRAGGIGRCAIVSRQAGPGQVAGVGNGFAGQFVGVYCGGNGYRDGVAGVEPVYADVHLVTGDVGIVGGGSVTRRVDADRLQNQAGIQRVGDDQIESRGAVCTGVGRGR